VPRLPGINHLEAVRALEKAGFRRDAGPTVDAFRRLL